MVSIALQENYMEETQHGWESDPGYYRWTSADLFVSFAAHDAGGTPSDFLPGAGGAVGISSAQIRKDLSQFGEFGKQGTGYNINYLSQQLRRILKLDRVWEIVVGGSGGYRHAIANYDGSRTGVSQW